MSLTIPFNMFEHEETKFLTAFFPAGPIKTTDNSHPYWDKIIAGLRVGDESVADLFELTTTVSKHFEALSERVSVKDGVIFLDGVETHNSLSSAILRFLDEGLPDWQPLVKFFENVLANPNEHSREQLYSWLDKHDFTINQDGLIVGYKAVVKDADDPDLFFSIHAGPAIVDGEEHEDGQVPNRIGSVITMPRDQVQHDPSIGCHRGLHVGTHAYAEDFGGYHASRALLNVLVNPRDVVSVPTDCNWAKVRCCRYVVVGVSTGKIDSILLDQTPEPEDKPSSVFDFNLGDRVIDDDGDKGIIAYLYNDSEDELGVLYDGARQALLTVDAAITDYGLRLLDEAPDPDDADCCDYCGSATCDGADGGECEDETTDLNEAEMAAKDTILVYSDPTITFTINDAPDCPCGYGAIECANECGPDFYCH